MLSCQMRCIRTVEKVAFRPSLCVRCAATVSRMVQKRNQNKAKHRGQRPIRVSGITYHCRKCIVGERRDRNMR